MASLAVAVAPSVEASAAEATATATATAEADAEAQKISIIRGRVLDSEKNILTGAVIYIEDLQVGAISDVNGYYTITDVKPGKHTLKISYIGYDSITKEIVAEDAKTSTFNITMTSGVAMGDVVVTSVMQGQHRALNSQKNALNMVDVISSDQAGKYPDQNIGDALKRISGINVQYDQGEARFGQVRGTPAEMSSVTINGDRVPSAEGEARSVQLDLIPTDMIQTIEVNKVVTADMEADAIGGSINLITKNSPSRRVINATVGTGYDMVSSKPQLNLGATYGDKVSDKFGYILSASYQNNPIGSDNTEFEWDVDDDGNAYIKEMQIRQYYVQRERQSYSAAFNWNINPNNKIDFKGIYNRRNDWENRYKTKVKLKDDGTLKELAVETKGGTEDEKYGRLEQQTTMNFMLGGEHLMGKLKLDWGATFSAASEDRPNESYIAFADEDTNPQLTVNYDDKRQPYIENAGDYLTLDAMMSGKSASEQADLLDELSRSQQEIQEYDYSAKVNMQYALSTGAYATTLKFGGKYTAKEKSVDVYSDEYKKAFVSDAAKEAYVTSALANTTNVDRDGFMAGEVYNFGRTFITREFMGNTNFNDANIFDQSKDTRKISEQAENYEAKENVAAGYIRVDQQLGKDLAMVVGVRVENTAIENSGWVYIDETGEISPSEEVSSSYTNVLPSLLVKWDANRDLKVRASYTQTIARPKYSDLVNKVVTDGTDEIKIGNPDLNASLSHNVDLSADYYFKSLGLVRAGVFYKRINDFIVDQTINDYDYQGETYDDFKMPVNAGNADLIGAEIAFSRDFGFIDPALKCVGFSGTYTYTYTDATLAAIEGREGEKMSLPGSPENTANASIYFEKWGLTARLSYNYASSFIDELGDTAFEDRYYDSAQYLDLNLNYSFKKHYNVYADVTNMLNQPLRYYQGTVDQTMQSEYYGPRFNLGLKVNF